MSYRVETALSNRAVCKATECKNAGIKIDKHELRFGAWIPFEDRGSWAWKHWGCVSGKQLENLRAYLEDPAQPGVYRWDYLDGYEGEEKNSLEKHPELQAKVRRVITQGFIDPDDFNGDPEMNKLGETGLRTAESKRRMREQKKNRDHEIAELQEKLAGVETERDALVARGASTSKVNAQIGGVKADLEHAEEETKPAIKKRVKDESIGEETKKAPKKKSKTKAKKEEDHEEDEELVKKGRGKKGIKREYKESESEVEILPAKKGRGKNAVKKEEGSEEEKKPAKKGRNKKSMKREYEASESEGEVMPAKKARGKNAVKKEEDSQEEEKPVKKGRGKKSVKKEYEESESEGEVMPAKKARGKGAVKKQEDDAEMATGDQDDVSTIPKCSVRGMKVKKETNDQNGVEEAAKFSNTATKRGRGKKATKEEAAEDKLMTDAAPAKKTHGKKGTKEEVSEDTPMVDAPISSLAGVEEFQAINAKTVKAMRQVSSEQNIQKVKAEAEIAESRGDPLPEAPSAQEISKLKPKVLSKGKKVAAPPRKGIDRRALSRGKTES